MQVNLAFARYLSNQRRVCGKLDPGDHVDVDWQMSQNKLLLVPLQTLLHNRILHTVIDEVGLGIEFLGGRVAVQGVLGVR
jgi:hypothetical protein